MPRLLPLHSVGNAIQKCTGIHVSGTRGIDGIGFCSFNRIGLTSMHDDGPFISERECYIFDVLVDFFGALDRICFLRQAFGLFFVAEEQVDGAANKTRPMSKLPYRPGYNVGEVLLT